MDGAAENDARVGLFTQGAEVISVLHYFGSTNVAKHYYRNFERLIVFSKTLQRRRTGGRNEVA